MHKSPWRLFALLLVIGFVMPSLVIFALETSLGHKPPAQALSEIARRQFAEGHNLFLLAAIGLLPFFVLDNVILLVQALTHDRLRLPWIGWGGFSGILALMIPMHVLVWLPLYTNQHASSTAVIAFFFIPVYCLVTMAVGLGVGEVAFRYSRRSRANKPLQPASGAGAPN